MFAITLEHVTIAYQEQPAVIDISAEICSGQMLALVGPNGAGKTTLLKALVNLMPVASGTITFFEGTFEQYRHQIAYVPQRSNVDWDFPAHVVDLVLMGCYHELGWFKGPGAHEYSRALRALEQVGLKEYADRPIARLSGGQQQRILLARALMQNATIYILDEPLTGVDTITEAILIATLKEVVQQGKTVIAVHHDLHTLQDYFDTVLLMNRTCIAYAPVQEIFRKEYMVQAYGRSTRPVHFLY